MKTHIFTVLTSLGLGIMLFFACEDDDQTLQPTNLLDINAGSVSLNELEIPNDVAPDAGITVVYNTNVDASTANSANIVLTRRFDGAMIPLDISVSGNTVTLEPVQSLGEGTGYSLVLSEGVAASNGTPFIPEIRYFATEGIFVPLGQVAYWAFDERLVEDISGVSGSNSGTTFANGLNAQALNLSADNQSYVTFEPGDAITGLKSFTLSFWVNPAFVDDDGNGSIDGILGLVNLSNTGNFWGNIDWFVENGSSPASATIRAHITNGSSETWITIENVANFFGTWTNHVLSYDASSSAFTYYVNGSVSATVPASWSGDIAFENSGPMVFGTVHFQTTPSLTSATGSQPWASFLTGLLDEVRIFDRALTAIEVTLSYQALRP